MHVDEHNTRSQGTDLVDRCVDVASDTNDVEVVLELGTDPAEEESVVVDQEHGSHPSPPGIVRCTSVPTPE